jgi:hypothetical protein
MKTPRYRIAGTPFFVFAEREKARRSALDAGLPDDVEMDGCWEDELQCESSTMPVAIGDAYPESLRARVA